MKRLLAEALGQRLGVDAPAATVERLRDDFDHYHLVRINTGEPTTQ